MDFQVRHNEGQSRFECDVDGRLSVVEYEMVETAIEHHLRVVPRCRYVASCIERHPQDRDLVTNE